MYFFNVKCETSLCENQNIIIEIANPNIEPLVICGVCSKQITNIEFLREEISES